MPCLVEPAQAVAPGRCASQRNKQTNLASRRQKLVCVEASDGIANESLSNHLISYLPQECLLRDSAMDTCPHTLRRHWKAGHYTDESVLPSFVRHTTSVELSIGDMPNSKVHVSPSRMQPMSPIQSSYISAHACTRSRSRAFGLNAVERYSLA